MTKLVKIQQERSRSWLATNLRSRSLRYEMVTTKGPQAPNGQRMRCLPRFPSRSPEIPSKKLSSKPLSGSPSCESQNALLKRWCTDPQVTGALNQDFVGRQLDKLLDILDSFNSTPKQVGMTRTKLMGKNIGCSI